MAKTAKGKALVRKSTKRASKAKGPATQKPRVAVKKTSAKKTTLKEKRKRPPTADLVTTLVVRIDKLEKMLAELSLKPGPPWPQG